MNTFVVHVIGMRQLLGNLSKWFCNLVSAFPVQFFMQLLNLVTPEAILTHECRFLHVVFYMAERAWSHAMEKKTAGPNAPQRIYMLGRFRKAVKWAALFSQLCSIKGDSRTSLEAEVCFLSFV